MKETKRVILLILFAVIVATGAAISLKAAIGVGAWDAVSQTISFMTGIKVGTCVIILNILCLLGQVLMLKKKFRLIQWLQVPLNLLIGFIVNLILYNMLGDLVIDSYIVRIGLLILSYCLCAFGVAAVMVLDLVTFSLEGVCAAISEKIGFEFSKLRQAVDVICVALVFLLAWIFKVELAVREGTIIGMLIFGPLLGIFMKIIEPVLKKYNLLKEVKIFEKVEVCSEVI